MNISKITRIMVVAAALFFALPSMAQNCYWVLLKDKQGSTFDPYTYFDAKAIERYKLNNADIYDVSNYPLAESYVERVNAVATEEVGQSRWLNAMAVMATNEQIEEIGTMPFVKGIRLIATDMQMAQARNVHRMAEMAGAPAPEEGLVMADQLLRMRGDAFRANNIDGKGVRVAVLDNGFPSVDKHKVFKHLRDNKQIIATWNFPDKKENVYGPGGHGTMVLSCIAGIYDSLQLGLAIGSEFLLARTEVEAEPFKEEVWWMMAMEWADKNGADIINSSLGYGIDRHYTYEMDGRSYVAKAANMAARKGILVCNSAGNEGDDDKWKTIITPADADSVLTVGGIEASLSKYRHISFSSFGPTADGRMKPNVCNFGQATVAKPRTTDESESVFGTSFSSPLTAGFCACAKQARPNLTAMQLKEEVEKSADLYPYFDYAFGYGVPQATYFVGTPEKATEPTFKFVDHDSYITVQPTGTYVAHQTNAMYDPTKPYTSAEAKKYTIFFKVTDKKGMIQEYTNLEFEQLGADRAIAFFKGGLYNKTLTVSLGGYTDSYRLSDVESKQMLNNGTIADYGYTVIDTNGYYNWNYDMGIDRKPEDLKINEFNDKWNLEWGLGFGAGIRTQGDELDKTPFNFNCDIRLARQIRRWYSIGVGIGYNLDEINYKKGMASPIDPHLGISDPGIRHLDYFGGGVELFQRIRIVPGGMMHKGLLWWDLGVYGHYGTTNYTNKCSGVNSANEETLYSNLNAYDNHLNYGLSTRIAYDFLGVYARYSLSSQTNAQSAGIDLPKLEMGLFLNF